MKSNLWWNKNIRLADLTEASKFTTPLMMAFFPEENSPLNTYPSIWFPY